MTQAVLWGPSTRARGTPDRGEGFFQKVSSGTICAVRKEGWVQTRLALSLPVSLSGDFNCMAEGPTHCAHLGDEVLCGSKKSNKEFVVQG